MPPRRPPTPPNFTVQWRSGPRVSAWDELWRRMLAEILRSLDRPLIDAVGEPGSE